MKNTDEMKLMNNICTKLHQRRGSKNKVELVNCFIQITDVCYM